MKLKGVSALLPPTPLPSLPLRLCLPDADVGLVIKKGEKQMATNSYLRFETVAIYG